ncbi:MAG: ABC-2 family transporter protein [Anaerolineae bacterium]|nr:ABC-2 family transporter protein [Anaerolineae bacterium]
MRREVIFLLSLWKANLLAAMEYRAAFISQVLGMMLNNAVYFVFWMIFFDRFKEVRGWGLTDMLLLFGVVAAGFGIGVALFGNVLGLAEVIARGGLDYYLSLPRPVLLHTLASRSVASGFGDFVYGVLSFVAAGQFSADTVTRFILGTLLAATVFISFLILVNSLAFWIGNANMIAQQATNAIITFSLYPITLFDGTAKLLLLTLIPAAFVGAIPAELVRGFSWQSFGQLFAAAIFFFSLAVFVFHRGLRRYESGSAIQVQL